MVLTRDHPQPESSQESRNGQADLARVLLELMGRGADDKGQPNHIVMSDDSTVGSGKFWTVPRDPALGDCRAHLTGERTIGGYLTLSAGSPLARVVVFDGDGDKTGHTLPFLVEQAERLKAAGASPLLEDSPADGEHAGGGKLWLAFSEPVRWQDAQATTYHYAPGLRSIEHFPPGPAGSERPVGCTVAA